MFEDVFEKNMPSAFFLSIYDFRNAAVLYLGIVWSARPLSSRYIFIMWPKHGHPGFTKVQCSDFSSLCLD